MITRATQLPDESEWNFDPVPDEEIELCFLYEYARAADGFKGVVAKWRMEHPTIVPAATRLLSRKGAFSFTMGPALEQRKKVLIFVQSKQPTKAERQQADANGRAWCEWVRFVFQEGGYPGRFPLDDPRVALFYFPPFPQKAWQGIESQCRRRAWLLLHPNLVLSGRLHAWLLLAGKDFSEQAKVRKAVQTWAGSPMTQEATFAATRREMEEHILAPGLIEQNPSDLKATLTLPMGFSFGKNHNQIIVADYCREQVTFIVNWAKPDGEIIEDLKTWLNSRRPHLEFRSGSVTSAREHLRKLGALRIQEAGITAEAASDIEAKTGKPFCSLYRSPDEYRRAKKQASDILNLLFPTADT